MPTQGLPLPTLLNNGQYRVDRQLAVGGLSLIYHGMDTKLNRPVAIKELFPHGSGRDGTNVVPSPSYNVKEWAQAKTEYLNEARAVAGFDHPGVVDVYDYFEENNTAYMVMKFISGQTLEQYTIERGGRLPEEEAKRFIREVGEALQELHSQNPPIFHRDIKPRNIMVTGQGHAVLIDFGGTREFMTELAGREEVMFTPGYTAPEQLNPLLALNRRPTADVFALGATLYFLLNGSDPYSNHFRIPPQIGESTRKAVTHALNQDPDKRTPNVRTFLNELYDLIGIPGMVAATPGWVRWLGGLIGAIILGVLTNYISGGGIVALFSPSSTPTPTAIAQLIVTPTTLAQLSPTFAASGLTATPSGGGADTFPSPTSIPIAVTTATPLACNTTALNASPHGPSSFNPDTAHAERSALRGSGSTFIAPLFLRWAADYSQKYQVDVSYSCTGSGSGIRAIQGRDVDFGTADYYEQGLKGNNGDIAQIPLTIGGVAIVTNFPGFSFSQRVYLSGPTLAGIYSGTITMWDDPAIRSEQQAAGNGGFPTLHQPITVFHRDLKSGTSDILTSYLYKASTGIWPLPSSLPAWRAGVAVGSNEEMANRVANTPYAIGYVELAYYALNGTPANGVSYAAIKNAAGQYLTPDAQSLTAAAASLKAAPADLDVDLTNSAQGYPVCGLTWMLVYTSYSANDADLRTSLTNLLGWILTDGQTYNLGADTGYVALPDSLRQRALDAVAHLGGT